VLVSVGVGVDVVVAVGDEVGDEVLVALALGVPVDVFVG
jgi:hypothetical protein